MIYIVITLLVIFLLSYITSGYDAMAPSVLFNFSFLFSSCWALVFSREWNFTPSLNTYLVITLGTLEFTVVCFIISKYNNVRHFGDIKIVKTKINKSNLKLINPWKLNIIIIIQLISIILTIKTLKRITGIGNLSSAIYSYRVATAFSDGFTQIHMPLLVSAFWYLSYVSGFYFSYFLIKEYIFSKKINKSLVVIITLSLALGLLKGDRTKAIALLIAMITYYYCLNRKYNNWSSKNNLKFILSGSFTLLIFLMFFKLLAILIGRNITDNSSDYLAVYIGAPLKNLDTFIRSYSLPVQGPTFETQTFIGIIGLVGKVMRWNIPTYSLSLPFQYINGQGLGNVYTTFYAWLYDFGYQGIAWIILVMASINQFVYDHFRYNKSSKSITFDILLYSYFSSTLIFSFFSDKFYEQVFNIQFLYLVSMCILLNWFITKFKC
jgi:oligosaccharide repeat unit polymerase